MRSLCFFTYEISHVSRYARAAILRNLPLLHSPLFFVYFSLDYYCIYVHDSEAGDVSAVNNCNRVKNAWDAVKRINNHGSYNIK